MLEAMAAELCVKDWVSVADALNAARLVPVTVRLGDAEA